MNPDKEIEQGRKNDDPNEVGECGGGELCTRSIHYGEYSTVASKVVKNM